MVTAGSGHPRVLVVEDDKKLAEALTAGIRAAGYQVDHAATGEEGFFLLHSQRPDLLILDLTLPHRSGLDVLRQVRQEQIDTRVLVLTSHNTVDDRVEGLTSGADDYLGKPFSFPELIARIEALLRRIQPVAKTSTIQIGDLRLDPRARVAVRAGVQLDLTSREFDVLLFLAEHRGRTVSREMLARDVWKEGSRFTPLDNVIDVQMARLRRKIDEPFPAKILHTIRGLGFCLREPQA